MILRSRVIWRESNVYIYILRALMHRLSSFPRIRGRDFKKTFFQRKHRCRSDKKKTNSSSSFVISILTHAFEKNFNNGMTRSIERERRDLSDIAVYIASKYIIPFFPSNFLPAQD